MQVDLLNPDPKQQHLIYKFKRLVQGPNSYMLQVQCECGEVTNTYSHACTVVKCKCGKDLLIPRGGKAAKTISAKRTKQPLE